MSTYRLVRGQGKGMDKKRVIDTLTMIAQDMADDAANFDGKPFNGKVVAEYFGNQGAAIAALADIIKSLVDDTAVESIEAGAVSHSDICHREKVDRADSVWRGGTKIYEDDNRCRKCGGLTHATVCITCSHKEKVE